MNTSQLTQSHKVMVWDLPTRLFHWAFAFCVIAAYVTVKMNEMDLHLLFGELVFGLVIFRLIWGIIGPHYARFTQFIKGPKAIIDYLKSGKKIYGHNPLGALSVIALLGVFAFQAVTGLYTGDGYLYQGPLYSIGREIRRTMTSWHRSTDTLMVIIVVLHLAAILYYRFIKKDNLVTPMITGNMKREDNDPAVVSVKHNGSLWIRFIIAAAIAIIATYYVSNGLSF